MALELRSRIEKRLFWLGAFLVVAGSGITVAWMDWIHGLSFLTGGAIGAANMALLRHSVGAIGAKEAAVAKRRVLLGFFSRLVLIPLSLYVMIQLLFLSLPTTVIGFAVFNGGALVEGLLEAFESRSK